MRPYEGACALFNHPFTEQLSAVRDRLCATFFAGDYVVDLDDQFVAAKAAFAEVKIDLFSDMVWLA